MGTIRKEKNLVYIQSEKSPDKYYTIDINTGVVLGLSHKPITTVNREIRKALLNNIDYYSCTGKNVTVFDRALAEWFTYNTSYRLHCLKNLQLADMLVNMGYKRNSYWHKETFDYIRDNMKEFSKWLSNGNENTSLDRFVNASRQNSFMKKYGNWITEDYEHFAPIIARDLGIGFSSNAYVNHIASFFNQLSEKNQKTYMALLFKYLLPFYTSVDEKSRYVDTRTYDKLEEIFKYAEYLNMEVKKDDFFKQYMALKKCYKVAKREYDQKALVENQLRQEKALAFENELFEVIIPTTEREFAKEASAQSNCVYSNYYPLVVNGKTNVVFIRRKADLGTSFITCEVYNGDITQYLAKDNGRVTDLEAIAFKELYQSHLKAMWELGI